MCHIMSIDFTNSDNLVETVHSNYDEDPSLLEPIFVDNLSETAMENSVLDYKGGSRTSLL